MFASRLGSLIALLVLTLSAQSAPKQSVTLEGHTRWVGALAFAPDSKHLVTVSADRTARIWPVTGGRATEILKGHTDTVSAVAFGAEGVIVTGGQDGVVRRWSPKKEPIVLQKRRGAVLTLALSPDGKTIAVGGFDGVITLLDPASGKEQGRLTGHKSWVNTLAFSVDGKQLVSGSSDGTACLWDVKTNKQHKSFALADPREIRGIALSPDCKTLAAAVRYGVVKAWSVETGKEIANLDAHEGESWSVCFTPDGKTLVSGGGDWGKPGTVKLWDATTWKDQATLSHPGEVLCVAVSRDGKWLAVGGMHATVRLWSLSPTKK